MGLVVATSNDVPVKRDEQNIKQNVSYFFKARKFIYKLINDRSSLFNQRKKIQQN
jgi:hypothetical protein